GIARAIPGTAWSGPRFFALASANGAPARRHKNPSAREGRGASQPARGNERLGEHRIFAPANSLACVKLWGLVMRPYWKGYLKLALVSCPIPLHAACSSAERIALRQINKATGNRLRQQLIDEETREPVAPEHKARGYEVAKGQYPHR